MIRHCVFLSLASEADLPRVREAMEILAGLVGTVPGFSDFAHGPNRDYEGKTPDHTYGFTCDFSDRDALAAYDRHPDHRRAGALLIAACKGGHDGILVADLDCG